MSKLLENMSSRVMYVPDLGQLRFAAPDDAAAIFELVTESMADNFRINKSKDVIYLIQKSVLSICQLNENEHIVGFLALQDYPPIPSIDKALWEEYIWAKYKAVELTARNTLFIHLICWSPIYGRELVDNMLRSVFMHDPHIQYIAMIKNMIKGTVLMPGQPRSEGSFRRIQVLERGISGDRLPILQVAERAEVCLRLRIRRAVEEDNDDLIPIIERRSQRMRDLYGDFYISELISRHPESERVILVCEVNSLVAYFKHKANAAEQYKEVAVGVMCLNTQINYEALEESFELSPFAGLRHLDDHSNIKRTKDAESTMSLMGPQYNIGVDNSLSTGGTFDVDTDGREKSSEMGVGRNDSFVQKGQELELSSQISHLSTKAQLDIMNILEDDEEELEFDIVNIDTHLLRLPRLISYEELSKSKIRLEDDVSKILDIKHKESVSDDKVLKKEKPKKSPPVSLTSHKTPEPTRYSGTPNAFLIELFAMHKDYDERFGFHLLDAAFETFPGRDYCVICLPSSEPSFALLEHFTLVTAYNYRGRFINESLFVAHINSVKGEVSVRRTEEYDTPYFVDILEHAPRRNELLEIIDSSLTSQTLESFVLLSRNQPVGAVVIAPIEDSTSMRTQYVLEHESKDPGIDGNVLVGVLSPAFEAHSRWYMREILRQSHYTQLFWSCRPFAKGDASPGRNLMSLASHMVPVAPYPYIPCHPIAKEKEKHKECTAPHALWTLNRTMTSMPKIYINRNIVVVGASRTGLAFLETLIMGSTSSYLTFTNLTLVSEHGLPTVAECLRAADTCVPCDGRYNDRYLKSIPYYFYVDVMTGVMVRIDRKKKCIYMKGGGLKYYDDLVLTCGRQFQHPDYLKELFERDRVSKEQNTACGRLPMDDPRYRPDCVPPPPYLPDNVMLINSLFDANTCLRKLLWMISESKDFVGSLNENRKIVVYGDCLDAYSCIASLLELGIEPKMLTFVEPFPPEDPAALRVNCFNNETVDERVQSRLDELGLQVYRRCYFNGWKTSGSRVETLHFMTHMQVINLPCFAFFYYGFKAINAYSFKAITECGLVYDGGLVVGTEFETNDPNVYGAGTCTRYSRRLYASKHAQGHYCSEDVGEVLAAFFLQKLDPFRNDNIDVEQCLSGSISRYSSSGYRSSVYDSYSNESRFRLSSRRWQPVLKFNSPIMHTATLPGSFHYFKLRKAGVEVPMAVQMSLPLQGHTLITDKDSNYFRLQLNSLHCVVSVTCLSKKPFPAENFLHLYGKHEAFFNKLLVRYQSKQIDDFYDFFSQCWLSTIYRMGFNNLMKDINDQDVGTVYDLLRSRFSLYGDPETPSFQQTCAEVPSCGFGPSEAQDLGTFRSVIDKFVARTSLAAVQRAAEITSECGQSSAVRNEARGFWKAVGGEKIVVAHLARYLRQTHATNQYAMPKPEYY